MKPKIEIPSKARDAALEALWMHTYGTLSYPGIDALRERVEDRIDAALEAFCWILTENPKVPTKQDYLAMELSVSLTQEEEGKYRSVHHKIACEWVRTMFLSSPQRSVKMAFPGPGIFQINPDGTFYEIKDNPEAEHSEVPEIGNPVKVEGAE